MKVRVGETMNNIKKIVLILGVVVASTAPFVHMLFPSGLLYSVFNFYDAE